MSSHRLWMYDRLDPDGRVKEDYFRGIENFIEHAKLHTWSQFHTLLILCPCGKCRNSYPYDSVTVYKHLVKNGFVENYSCWRHHGEDYKYPDSSDVAESSCPLPRDEYQTMVGDGMGYTENVENYVDVEEDQMTEAPTRSAEEYYKLMHSANEPVYEGCTTMSKLSLVSQLINIKSESGISQRHHERYVALMKGLAPDGGHNVPSTYYQAKKLLLPLRLPHKKIDMCIDNCMLFYGADADLSSCSRCQKSRYKIDSDSSTRKQVPANVLTYFPIGPRLQRLYMSGKTADHMTWHHRNRAEEGFMSHPSHGAAWKHFDGLYPEFASEPRNVRLGLCTDGFNPFDQFGKNYSCWPVMVCVYNLSPGLCMKDPYIFLSLIVPGPNNPGRDLDMSLRHLVDELKELWDVGIKTYDAAKRENFTMRVTLMWTISDFPAYGMLSGWSTHGKLACPHCMSETDSHYLRNGRKVCWFDCHRKFLPKKHPDRKNRVAFIKDRVVKGNPVTERLRGSEVLHYINRSRPIKVFGKAYRKVKSKGYGIEHNWTKKSIFWELPYWADNLIRHNLDLMHIEKNGLENTLFTVMDVKLKTKDNAKSREDLKSICCREELHLLDDARVGKIKPKAKYVLSRDQQNQVRTWLQQLKLPDGCASNISRCTATEGFAGLKSHDCHVLMEKLLPVALRHLLPNTIWDALVDLCHFYRDICSFTLRVDHLHVLERNIPRILCKLEKIFPPAFFDVMEHLPIHLPFEAINGGPVQYRWMYPFESYLGKLKYMVRQKAHVEGSITEAYLLREVSTFCAMYFGENVQTNLNQPSRNDDGGEIPFDDRLSIFRHPGRPSKCPMVLYYLTKEESDLIHLYALKNTSEISPLLEGYNAELLRLNPNSTVEDRDEYVKLHFADYFRIHVEENILEISKNVVTLSKGPYAQIQKYKGYFTNGYRFDIFQGRGRKTNNSGVMVKGTYLDDDDDGLDYYGEIIEIWDVKYTGVMESVVFFKCIWFSNDEKNMRVHPTSGLVEIRRSSRMSRDDPFILASQAQQVCYLNYASMDKAHKNWQVVCKVRARKRIDMTHIEVVKDGFEENEFYQEPEMSQPVPLQPNVDLNDPTLLVDRPIRYEVVDIEELEENVVEGDGFIEDGMSDSDKSISTDEEVDEHFFDDDDDDLDWD